jgi:hypothetical protein
VVETSAETTAKTRARHANERNITVMARIPAASSPEI